MVSSGSRQSVLVGYKKRRLQGACDMCRKKKVRCDSAEMPNHECSNCLAFGSPCTHSAAEKRSRTLLRPKSGRPHADTNSERLSNPLVGRILSQATPFEVPNEPDVAKQMFLDLAQYARGLERELGVQDQITSGDSISHNTDSSQTSDVVNDAEDDPELLSYFQRLTVSSADRFFGSSSGLMLLKTAMDMQRDSGCSQQSFVNRRRTQFWTIYPWEIDAAETLPVQEFPDHDLLLHLIDLYFDNVNLYFPFLHRPTIEAAIAQGLHLSDYSFGSVILGICAVGSRYSDDSRVLLEGTNSFYSAGWKWFRQIKLFGNSLAWTPSLHEIQMYILVLFYLQGTSTPEPSWTIVGLAIRHAQDVGAHRRKRNRTPTVENELWKRAYWLLISFDVFVSALLGRPRAASFDEFDLDLPLDCDDEYWTADAPFQQSPDQPSRIGCFVAYLNLIKILADAHSSLYSLKGFKRGAEYSAERRQAVIRLDSDLNKWLDSIPEHLRWDPHRKDLVFFKQSALLYAIYYNVQIFIHRPFIPSPMNPSPSPLPSLTICTNAARCCCHLIAIHSRRGLIYLPQMLISLFTSSMVLFLNVWASVKSGKPMHFDRDLQLIQQCIDILHTYESRLLPAGRICDVIHEVASAGNLTSLLTGPNSALDGTAFGSSTGTQEVTSAFTSIESRIQDVPNISGLPFLPITSLDLGRWDGLEKASVPDANSLPTCLPGTPFTIGQTGTSPFPSESSVFTSTRLSPPISQEWYTNSTSFTEISDTIPVMWSEVPTGINWPEWERYIAELYETVGQFKIP